MSIKKKIAIIIQRYGVQVNGGAEVHARLVAEQLMHTYDVTILTSCAIDYQTWEPVLSAGEEQENGIRILRFQNEKRASSSLQSYYGYKQRGRLLPQKIYSWLNKPNWWLRLFPQSVITEQDGVAWLQAQGPAMPVLVNYIAEHKNEYSAFIFFTALYYPTALGILQVPKKSILIPTIHDEKASYFPVYRKVMAAAEWIFFNTLAEMKFAEKIFPLEKNKKRIVGVGIDSENKITNNSIPVKFGITTSYIIYIGRISAGKGCNTLINYFNRYIKETNQNIQLVLVGVNNMPVQEYPSIIFTGFVSDEEKKELLKQAATLVIPSLYESLSLVLLESFAAAIPVIANGNSEVLKDHIDKSGGGWIFYNYTDFKSSLTQAIKDGEMREEKGKAGYQYVSNEYSWKKILSEFDTAIHDIEHQNV